MKKIIGALSILFSGVFLVYSVSVATDFFSFTHNGKYSGEFAVKECKVKYTSLEDAAMNCPNVEGSYFLIRLLPAVILSLVLGRISMELLSSKDD